MEHEAAMEESRIELEAVKRQMEEQEQEYEREYQKALEQAAQTALDRKQGIDNEGDYPGDFETGEEKLPYPSEEAYLNGVMDEEVEKFTAKLEELNMQKLAWEEKIAEENMAKEVIHKQTSHLKEIEPNAEENGEGRVPFTIANRYLTILQTKEKSTAPGRHLTKWRPGSTERSTNSSWACRRPWRRSSGCRIIWEIFWFCNNRHISRL